MSNLTQIGMGWVQKPLKLKMFLKHGFWRFLWPSFLFPSFFFFSPFIIPSLSQFFSSFSPLPLPFPPIFFCCFAPLPFPPISLIFPFLFFPPLLSFSSPFSFQQSRGWVNACCRYCRSSGMLRFSSLMILELLMSLITLISVVCVEYILCIYCVLLITSDTC